MTKVLKYSKLLDLAFKAFANCCIILKCTFIKFAGIDMSAY